MGAGDSFVVHGDTFYRQSQGASVHSAPILEHLRTIGAPVLNTLFTARAGEVRLGQRARPVGPDGALPDGARIAVLGVAEDFGVRANLGRPGARRAWRAFLPRFLAMQSNRFLDGAEIAIAGTVEVRDLRKATRGLDATIGGPRARADALERLRQATAELDARVTAVVEHLRRAGCVPIVVGGGHNNAYGILAGCARAAGRPLGCVNVDLHADLRPREGRHSGNAFSYARHDGHLARYAVLGMSEASATQAICEAIDSDAATLAVTFESMLRGACTSASMAAAGAAHVAGMPCTLELDVDAVAQAPASAAAASGFSAAEFRAIAMQVASAVDLHAVHVAEAAPGRGPWPDEMLGKFVAEVVRDMATAVAARPAAGITR
jgi:formiminoglutamase